MTVTSNNVLGFKEYLKNNKEAFKSNIIPAYMGDISASLGGSFPTGTNALTPIKVILFDYNETVDIQNELLEGDYVYLPGTSNDKVRLQNGTAYADFNFDANGDVTGQTVGNYYVVGGYRLELLNIGGGLWSQPVHWWGWRQYPSKVQPPWKTLGNSLAMARLCMEFAA